jgi:G:T-mismatch repair DNA endonuclease (very short patch repair protein)
MLTAMAKGRDGYKVRTIVCVSCGTAKTGRMSPRQHYCSLSCYRESPRPVRRTGQTRNCVSCSAPFYASKCNDAARFCGSECYFVWKRRTKDNYTCKICKSHFARSPSLKKNGNPTYCSLRCRDADPDRVAQLRRMNADQATAVGPNNVESVGYAMLDDLGLAYEPQALLFGKFCVDAWVPSRGLVVQFDGDYWHAHPERFPQPDQRQQRRVKLDRSQDAYMAKAGVKVVRVWECELMRRPEIARARILAAHGSPEYAAEANTLAPVGAQLGLL